MAHVAFPLRCSHARLSAGRTPSADPRSLLLPGSTHVSPVALVAVVAVVSSAAGVSPPTARGVHRLADADADRLDAATDLAGAERAAKHAKEAYDAAVAESTAASAAVDAARATAIEAVESTVDAVEAADDAMDLATGPVVDDSRGAAVDAQGDSAGDAAGYRAVKSRYEAAKASLVALEKEESSRIRPT